MSELNDTTEGTILNYRMIWVSQVEKVYLNGFLLYGLSVSSEEGKCVFYEGREHITFKKVETSHFFEGRNIAFNHGRSQAHLRG